MMRLTAAAFGVVTASFLPAGCHSPAKIQPANSVVQVLEELSTAGTANPCEYWIAAPSPQHFDAVNDDGVIIGHITVTRSETDRFGAKFVEAEDQRSETFWRTDDDGNIVMSAHIDHEQHALTTFDPPLVLWHSEMTPGQPMTSESAMRVVDSRNPKKLKETGKATRTMEYLGDQRIRTPIGESVAQRFESRVIADLRLADADEHVIRFIVPEIGMVAEQSVEEVRILGALSTTKRRTIIQKR